MVTPTKAKLPDCKDCRKEGVTTRRPVATDANGNPVPGRRCVTHHRAKRKRDRHRAAELRVQITYEMSPQTYDRLYALQGGLCYICRSARGIVRRLAVDHDHKLCDTHPPERGCPRCWRGLLCKRCNQLVAWYGVEALLRAIKYLKDPPARRILGTANSASVIVVIVSTHDEIVEELVTMGCPADAAEKIANVTEQLSDAGVTRAVFGPLESYVHCDAPGCLVEAPVSSDELPPDWTKRDGGTYCPLHN